MKGHKKITVMLLAAIMMLAPTLIMAQALTTQPAQKPTGEPLDIEVWTNKEEGGSFGQGENLVIYFRANRDCFVTVYDLDTKGDINLLYPYDYRDDNFIQGGVVYTIPDYYDDFVLRVNGPPGLEFVQAIASDRDFPVPDWSYNYRDPDGWRDIKDERTALAYLEFINNKYFQTDHCYMDCDLNYTYFEVRKNWQYSWDSYYYDDYSYYDDVNVVHFYHPYYYRPALYDPYWDPWDWCGTMYIGYPFGGAVYINGIFYGYAPLFIPRISIGWCDVRIHYHDRDYYHDRVRIRRGLSHELYHEGGYKWKTDRKADFKDNVMAQKYYPKEKSLSFRSGAKYTLGGRSGNVYKPDGRVTKGDRGTTTTYKPGGNTTKTRDSYGTKTRTGNTTTKDRNTGLSKTGKTTTEKSKAPSKGQTLTKEGTSSGKSKESGSSGSKSGTYDKGTKTKSGSGSSGTKSTKTRKSATPSARFEKKGERTAYGSTDNRSGSQPSRSYGNTSSRSSGNNGSPGYRTSGTSGSKSGSSSTYGRGSSSSSKGSSGTYSKGSSRSSGSKSSGSYRGSSGSRSSGKSSGSSSKSSGGSRGSSKSRK